MQALIRRHATVASCMKRCYMQNLRALSETATSPDVSYQTQTQPTYRLPFYGSSEEEISALPNDTVRQALRSYGGLMRPKDEPDTLRQRLISLTRADYRPLQLTIEGVVVSDKMDKSVVVAARRKAYSTKIRVAYLKTKRFMAHDEFNLCREGDRVVIRSCRPLSRHKSHVVVENFGDKTRAGPDDRKIVLEDIA